MINWMDRTKVCCVPTCGMECVVGSHMEGRVTELVYVQDLKSCGLVDLEGSSPSAPTNCNSLKIHCHKTNSKVTPQNLSIVCATFKDTGAFLLTSYEWFMTQKSVSCATSVT